MRESREDQRCPTDLFTGSSHVGTKRQGLRSLANVFPRVSTAVWISSAVVWRPIDRRKPGRGSSRGRPVARRTCDGSSEPLAHAEPALLRREPRRAQLVGRGGLEQPLGPAPHAQAGPIG